MRYWPVPESYTRSIPTSGAPGSFLEDRGDRCHCGVDIYAAAGSPVLAIEDGVVRTITLFTSQEQVPYWNTTFSVLLESAGGRTVRYAELETVAVAEGARVQAGMLLGSVGTVLSEDQIDGTSPPYIQSLKKRGNTSMLHLEVYPACPVNLAAYRGGNWYGDGIPEHLLDPADYLQSAGGILRSLDAREGISREART